MKLIENLQDLLLKHPFVRDALERRLERLAELEHEQWTQWSKSLIDRLKEHKDSDVMTGVISELENRWAPLWKPYAELAEVQKEKDREWAGRALDILEE